MPMTFDETSLYKLVLAAVRSREFDDKEISELVSFVKRQYLETLKSKGIVLPLSSQDGLETEIRDSLRTITYGFYSIKEYNDKRQGF